MSKKQHFCKTKINDNFCGKTDPESFEKGRYSICKSCKNENTKKINKKNFKMDELTLNSLYIRIIKLHRDMDSFKKEMEEGLSILKNTCKKLNSHHNISEN